MPVQLTKASSITDQINLLSKSSQVNEMDVRRIKRDIEQIKAVDLAGYYMLLGMFYSVIGNEDECRGNHERSLHLSSEAVFLANYAFSMKRFSAGADALDLFLRAFNIAPTSRAFADLLQAMVYAGDLREFDRVVAKYAKTHPTENFEQYDFYRYVTRVQSCLERAQISAGDFRLSMQIVEKVLVATGNAAHVEAMNIKGGSFDGVPHLEISILLKQQSESSLSEINDLIAEAMIAADDIEAWNRLVYTVGPWYEPSENVA